MDFYTWLHSTDEGKEALESLTSGPVSQSEAEHALEAAWNAAYEVSANVPRE
jgi:hypothetical protein